MCQGERVRHLQSTLLVILAERDIHLQTSFSIPPSLSSVDENVINKRVNDVCYSDDYASEGERWEKSKGGRKWKEHWPCVLASNLP